MDKKVTSILCYFFGIIGWLVAFCAGDKEGAKFHLNQSLVLFIATAISSVVTVIPVIGWIVGGIAGIVVFVLWVMGVISAIQGTEKEVPLLGKIKLLK